MAAKTDNFQSPDYFNVDELLTEEHKLVRESVRAIGQSTPTGTAAGSGD